MSEASGTSVPTLAVTGSTGRLGGRVARRLAVRGVPQTLLVRSPERAPRLPGAVAVRAEYADQNAVRDALTGTRTVFMVSASESADRLARHRAFVDAVAEAGVRHLVYVSFYGAAPDAAFTLARDHFHTEQHIRASGLAYTFLRDNLYAEFVPDLVGEDGVIRGPAGNGRAAFVGQDDIADAAAAVLLRPDDHAGTTYDLTGPESLSLDQAAAVLSERFGRTVTYQPETMEAAYASRASFDAPPWQLDAWVSTYTAIASGELDGVSDAVPRLTGHPATSLADVIRGEGDRRNA
ncbi:SDR family oxidoreductase [Streptomyces sp. LBUM 1478]|uniref:NAD(P)-binding domain-containing protein n=1 Tax=Streptomyces scabiei (strain 87.22) TaxID=680198 RepID=C9YUB1_STRSW|nr:SDR family oxidoreductase [Streptomyces scabiei]MBP5910628.1 SDR family oxidoreductase [Streptomyces sp. LBUM 1478]MBP5934543.1 SDR family oxidoreductase [Streptomyces sp. LBUM 1479]MDX2536243.1 SDR family oxidoreductase [Streptomyces scabiei]MDX2577796.1 SDR family oxidoreductase [Streptomyces scabiei]MDX2654380.1 SDR family oxidoreductase [Streptomyces scabiei]